MPGKISISFPHMGDYSAVFTQVLRHMFPQARVFPAPPMTQRTVELGGRHSPDFVCSPFKFNLGNYIEALEEGANVLFQTGLGCRYGYYGELQEQILRDLGYQFRFVCLSRDRANPQYVYQTFRELGCPLSTPKMIEAGLLALASIRVMDRYDYFMRENAGFETVPGSFEGVRRQLLREIEAADGFGDLLEAGTRSRRAAAGIRLDRPENPLRVGIVGDLYTLMEPFSNFYVERQLAKDGIAVSRKMSVWFLMFGQNHRRAVKKSGRYLHHTVGANGVDSVAQSLSYARQGYDGIIHMKSFGCIPELNATPALLNLSRHWGIPILDLSFDSHTSETGVQTRLEAFSDMIRMKKEEEDAAKREPGRGRGFGVHQGRRAGQQR
ncbi:hypothetical protein [Papillibacter cinnamivorans]|uniref:Predicted nucleotide-binding protein, sugar kinase/HSP70/actin superfamily n=1 Tax=Papillibacter cinnamivorans DSM 12816 TaxID=1122930 RepID=A0A1W1YNZ9_9FIRM|nr:hypothetical protein [Papillibacter cinnamivorans]SMC37852.1 Predicted nucleotide-binding protein, sugar kinase/HSP70/actin superfamily [Papillibacter cinnamivorans DSM 12816]